MNKRPIFLLGTISVLYVALRLWGLTDSCLWFDEIFSINAAEHSWDTLLWFVAQDLIHPPLFYVLLKLWISIGGSDLFWLRLFPAVFAILAAVPFLQLCRELRLRLPTVAFAFALFAVNGVLIKYAQEVRMYSLLLFLSLMSMWLFVRFFVKGKSFILLMIINVLLVYTHYFGLFVIGSEVVVILIFQRIKIRQTLLMFVIVSLGFVPWMFAIYEAAASGAQLGQNIGWIERPGFLAVFDFVFDVVEPFYYQASSADPSTVIWITVPLLVIIGIAKLIYFAEIAELEHKEPFYLLAFFTGVPLTIALIGSWILPYSVWGSRHLIILFAPMTILSAIFVTEIKSKRLSAAASAGIVLLIAAAFAFHLRRDHPQYVWCSWEIMATEMSSATPETADPRKLYVFEDLIAYHFWFSSRKAANIDVRLIKGIEGIRNDPAYFLPRGFDGVRMSELDGIVDDEIWIAFRRPTPNTEIDSELAEMRIEAPVTNLQNRGYAVGEVWQKTIGRETAFLIRMKRVR